MSKKSNEKEISVDCSDSYDHGPKMETYCDDCDEVKTCYLYGNPGFICFGVNGCTQWDGKTRDIYRVNNVDFVDSVNSKKITQRTIDPVHTVCGMCGVEKECYPCGEILCGGFGCLSERIYQDSKD